MHVRTDGQETPTSPPSDEPGSDEHSHILRTAEKRAANQTENGAVYDAGFASPTVHDVG
jgi:hypothetical protein